MMACISVAGSADIDGSPAEINNNSTSFTAATLFQFIGDKFNLLRRCIAVPVYRYLNEAVDDSLGRKFNVICDNIGRVLFREEVEAMMPQSTLGFIIISLLAFTEIKSQGNPESPFQTHPKAIMVSINSVVIYGFTSTAEVVISAAGFDRTSIFALITRMGRMASLYILVTSLAYLFYF